MKRLIIIIFYFIFIYYSHSQSIFDSVKWIKDKKDDDIQLYYDENDISDLFYYKAVKIIKNVDAEILYEALTNFKEYPKIFPRTVFFNVIKVLGNNQYIIHSKADFTPLKKREYYINLNCKIITKDDGNKKYILQWKPVRDIKAYNNHDNKSIIAEIVYGRWIVEELGNNRVLVSVEYHNDWKLSGPKMIIHGFQKDATIGAIKNLLKYLDIE